MKREHDRRHESKGRFSVSWISCCRHSSSGSGAATGVISAAHCVVAYATIAPAIPQRGCYKIISSKRMPTRAMCLQGVAGGPAISAKNVLAVCHGLKMVRVNARPISAKMIQGQTPWDGSAHTLIDFPMRHLFATRSLHSTISVSRQGADPFPTPALLNDVPDRECIACFTVYVRLHKHSHHAATVTFSR